MARRLSIFRPACVALACLVLAACGSSGKGSKTELVLGDQVGLLRARAEAAGVFKNVPYAYQWANFPGAAPLFEALNAGAVDTAVAGDAPLILAAAAHVPLRVVAAMKTDGQDVAILVPRGSTIRSIGDLRGHRVIVSSARGSVAQYLLLEALREAGVASSALSIGFMLPNDAASAFEAGRIDAWVTFGSYQASAEARGARLLKDGRGINSGIAVLVVAKSALDDPGKRVALADYLKRQARANVWSRTNPEAYAALYRKQTGVSLDVARVITHRENAELMPVNPQIVAALQTVADRFQAFDVIPQKVEIAPLVDNSVFPAKPH